MKTKFIELKLKKFAKRLSTNLGDAESLRCTLAKDLIIEPSATGLCIKIARFRLSKLDLYVYLDEFSGALRYWIGFFAEDESYIRKISNAARKVYKLSKNEPSTINASDLKDEGGLQQPLKPENLDKIFVERLGKREHFCGFYSRLSTSPKNPDHENLVAQAVDFIKKVRLQELEDHNPSKSPTEKTPAKKNLESEIIAVRATKKALKNKGFTQIKSRAKDPVSYDLQAKNPRTGKIYEVEVKGTTNSSPHFYITYLEEKVSKKENWLLSVVTDCKKNPQVHFLTEELMRSQFIFKTISSEATMKNGIKKLKTFSIG